MDNLMDEGGDIAGILGKRAVHCAVSVARCVYIFERRIVNLVVCGVKKPVCREERGWVGKVFSCKKSLSLEGKVYGSLCYYQLLSIQTAAYNPIVQSLAQVFHCDVWLDSAYSLKNNLLSWALSLRRPEPLAGICGDVESIEVSNIVGYDCILFIQILTPGRLEVYPDVEGCVGKIKEVYTASYRVVCVRFNPEVETSVASCKILQSIQLPLCCNYELLRVIVAYVGV